jgi:hypothetical protein
LLCRPHLEKLDEKGAVDDEAEVEETQGGPSPFLSVSSSTATTSTSSSSAVAGKADDDDIDESLPSSQTNVKNAPVEEDDDEIIIDDFDD